jgi:hypothetical protein
MNSIKLRNDLFKKCKASYSDDKIKEEYNRYKSIVSKEIMKNKREYVKRSITAAKGNGKTIWKTINGVG